MTLFPKSLQARTAVAIAFTFFLFLSLFFYTSYVSIQRSLVDRSDGEVREALNDVATALPPNPSAAEIANLLARHSAIGESPLRFVLLRRRNNGFDQLNPTSDTIATPEILLPIERRPGIVFPFSSDEAHWRMVSIARGNIILGAAYNTVALEEAGRSVVEVFSYYLLAGLIVGIIGGIFLSRYLIGPIGALAASARNLVQRSHESDAIADRLPASDKVAELAGLAQSINTLLDTRDSALAHERNFAADVAHELRTPLTVLKGEIEVELRVSKPVGSHSELLRSNLEEIDRLINTVQDLLELAEMESVYHAPASGAVCSLYTAAAYASERLQPLADEREIVVTLPTTDVLVTAHEERVTRLIYNLLLNAIQHSNRGSVIVIRLSRLDTGYILEVEDEGEGIPAGAESYLFERFQRAGSGRNQNGAGLGLAIAKSITDYYGFTLDLRNNQRGGTTASVTIPMMALAG